MLTAPSPCRELGLSVTEPQGLVQLRALNRDPLSVSIIAPIQLLPAGPSLLMAMPHPCLNKRYGNLIRGNFDDGGFEWGYLLQELLRGAPMPTPEVVDVGANLGLYSLWPAALGANVTSVEIQHRRAHALRLSAEANGWLRSRRLVVHNVALGAPRDEGWAMRCVGQKVGADEALEDPGTCTRVQLPEAGGAASEPSSASSFSRAGMPGREPPLVPFATLDALFPTGHAYILKVDCDGCEDKAYRGMRQLLMQQRVSFMLIEVSSPRRVDLDQSLTNGSLRWLSHMFRRYDPPLYVLAIRGGPPDRNKEQPHCTSFQGVPLADYLGDAEHTEETDRLRVKRDGWRLAELGRGLARWPQPAAGAFNGTVHHVAGGWPSLVEYMRRCGPRVERANSGESVMIDIMVDMRGRRWQR